MIVWNNVSLLVKIKFTKKNLGAKNWVRNYVFRHFLKLASLVFLDIAQDCSLGQCLTSTRAETSEKNFVAQIRA